MDDTLISWNAQNWLTVVLMAMIGFFALGVVTQAARRFTAPKTRAGGNNVVYGTFGQGGV